MSLDALLQNYAVINGTRKVFLVEDGAKVLPRVQTVQEKRARVVESLSAPAVEMSERGLDMSDQIE